MHWYNVLQGKLLGEKSKEKNNVHSLAPFVLGQEEGNLRA